jgi:hypothetical protein
LVLSIELMEVSQSDRSIAFQRSQVDSIDHSKTKITDLTQITSLRDTQTAFTSLEDLFHPQDLEAPQKLKKPPRTIVDLPSPQRLDIPTPQRLDLPSPLKLVDFTPQKTDILTPQKTEIVTPQKSELFTPQIPKTTLVPVPPRYSLIATFPMGDLWPLGGSANRRRGPAFWNRWTRRLYPVISAEALLGIKKQKQRHRK